VADMVKKGKKPICTFCLMMRLMLVFFAVVGVFILNGMYQFLG